jgi:hypothetical protein
MAQTQRFSANNQPLWPHGERLWHAVLSATLAGMKALQDQSSIRRTQTAQLHPWRGLMTLMAHNGSRADLAADSSPSQASAEAAGL